MDIDWKRLSAVEMASGIEVIYLSRLFRKDHFLHKKIIKHAIDEYRHSSIFYKYHKVFSKTPELISSAHSLLGAAGLDNSPVDREEKNIFKYCSYVYVGEYRALDFNSQATNLVTDKKIIKDIEDIEKDELNHASGVMKYLKIHPKYKYVPHITLFKIRYFFQRFTNIKIYNKLRGSSSNFLAKRIFKIFPKSLFEIKDTPINL